MIVLSFCSPKVSQSVGSISALMSNSMVVTEETGAGSKHFDAMVYRAGLDLFHQSSRH